MTQSGAVMSSRRVASRSRNARLKRSMTSSVVLVMIAVPCWLGWDRTLPRFRGHGAPEGGSRSVVAQLDRTTAPISSVVAAVAISWLQDPKLNRRTSLNSGHHQPPHVGEPV